MDRKNELNGMWGSGKSPPFFYRRVGFARFCLCFLVFSLTSGSLIEDCFSQEITESVSEERIVTGTGVIIDQNVVDARDEALSQAFSRAIEEYLTQRLRFQKMVNNFQRLDEEILARAKEHIQDYQIMSEFKTDEYVKVLIKARINSAILEKKLKSMGMEETESFQIDVLFLVSEKKRGFPTTFWWIDPSAQASLTPTELFLSQVFEEKGFRVINRSFFPPEESYDEGMLEMNLSDEDAVKWGRLLSAQVVVTGEANIDEGSRASVFLKAIRVMDGATIAQGYREGITSDKLSDDKNPVELAIQNWADDMIAYISDSLEPSEKAMAQLIITLKGLKGYNELQDVKEFLTENFPEIKSVLERRLQRELIKVSVETEGDSYTLAKRMLRHPKVPFLFEISEVNEQGFTVVRR
jgi:hypothetical protein